MKRSFSDYTESEFLEFVRSLFNVADTSESDDIKNILEFKLLTEHPDGSDLIFYPRDDREDSPEGVVQEVKEWRKANGKPGFRGE
ncbi:bacteriocin immunity protein [Kluyvera ascorbata]|uniref:bacteriocin immunity protein n=1 Tax=Kluyvera ascorbata TaxID=51288 RepID=UPI0029412E84|nr:bacteriocin immunity protein [Kluyvera ascorbata]HED1309624.1 bacteriocin immunity protein [Kluyvera ascorbata]